MTFTESELILNSNNSIYHLNLLPEDVADIIFTVGDPDRVPQVSQYFDSIELRKQKREFVTHTGYIGKNRVSVMSTGISTDNIDIFLNELDALVNIDFNTRTTKRALRSLQIIRIGTAGGLQPDIELDSVVVSKYGIGLDGLGNLYQLPHSEEEQNLQRAFVQHFENHSALNIYTTTANQKLVESLEKVFHPGITVTCGGFYGPQGRVLRAQPSITNLVEKLQQFSWNNEKIANFEMETAGLYAMGTLLGHQCCSVSAIIANRCIQQFSKDITKTVDKTIQKVLETICG